MPILKGKSAESALHGIRLQRLGRQELVLSEEAKYLRGAFGLKCSIGGDA